MGRLNEGAVRKLIDFLFKADSKKKTQFRKRVEKIDDKELRDEILDSLNVLEKDIEKSRKKWEKENEDAIADLYKRDPNIGKFWDF